MGPLPPPIPGNNGGARDVRVGEMGARTRGNAVVGEVGGLCWMGGRLCGRRAPGSIPPPSVVGPAPIAL